MIFEEVKSKKDYQQVARLSNIIWREHYTPIIGKAQVDYMLEKFQSEKAIGAQIGDGVYYYLLKHQNKAIGYISFYPKDEAIFISKVYVLGSERGKGFGKDAMNFIEQQAINLRVDLLRLTVNKYNTNSIGAYEKMGFCKKESVVMDIGGGFVMDDFVMEKSL